MQLPQLYEIYGVKYFFFDEIHKYPNWNRELKNIYDSYTDITIVFSGSSSVELVKGTYDLSRRGVLFQLEGLSFREYLLFKGIKEIGPVDFNDLIAHRGKYEKELNKIDKLRGHFKSFLKNGYYPFFLEDERTYYQKLLRIIEKTIFEDIPNFYKLKTENLFSFKKILSYIASIPPAELNYNNISKNIGFDNKTVYNYINILYQTGMVELVPPNKTGSNLLRQKEKIYLNNPNMYQAITEQIGLTPNVGAVREIFFINMMKNSNNEIFWSKVGDFEANDINFEIGGKNKKIEQIKNHLHNSYLVKDDITYGTKYEIPLYMFGLLY